MTNSKHQQREPLSPQNQATRTQEILLSDIKARVDKVKFEGIARTKDDVLVNISKPLFDSTSFEELVLNVNSVKEKLNRLGGFKGIGVYIDASKGPDATVNGYEIVYKLVETGRVTGGVHTYIGNNNTGSLITAVRLPNVLGRGEAASVEYQRGTKHTTGFNCALTKPLSPWSSANPILTLSSFQQGADSPWSHYRQMDRGFILGIASKIGTDVEHAIRWEGVWRDVSCLRDAAFAVREESGHTLKSSIKNIISKDTRDDRVLPREGGLIRLENEIAGLGGNVGFLKNDLEVQYNVPFLGDFVLQGTFKAGTVKPTETRIDKNRGSSKEKLVTISDRYFLGGPLNLRGFKQFGIGPHSEGCALGADAYWISGVHIYTPLPFRPGQGGWGDLIRTHFFLNAGTIGNVHSRSKEDQSDHNRIITTMTNRLRYSAGVGLVVGLNGVARFELSYALPLGQQPGDKIDSRLQFGLGVSFV